MKKALEKINRDLSEYLVDLDEGHRDSILLSIESSIEEVIRDEPWFP